MAYTLSEAARATGRGKTTLLRMIKAGRLSGSRDPLTGGWLVEPAELHRLYPVAHHGEIDPAHHSAPRIAELEGLRERDSALIAAHERTIEDLRRRLDTESQERRQAQTQLAALLTDQRPRKRWWQRTR